MRCVASDEIPSTTGARSGGSPKRLAFLSSYTTRTIRIPVSSSPCFFASAIAGHDEGHLPSGAAHD
jgi:hypothetical protein